MRVCMRGCIIRYFPQVGLEGEPGTCYHPHTIDNLIDALLVAHGAAGGKYLIMQRLIQPSIQLSI